MLTRRSRLTALLFSPALFCLGQAAQKPAIPVNYDEALVGSYRLPDPLLLANGKPVRDAKTWYKNRRPELVRLFETEQYGRSPEHPTELSFDPFDKGTPAFDGKAVRKQMEIHFSAEPSSPKADLALYLPAVCQEACSGAALHQLYRQFRYYRRPGPSTRRNLESG